MEISLLRELQNKVKYECDICHKQKLLEYVMMDNKGNTFSVCRECKDSVLEDNELN